MGIKLHNKLLEKRKITQFNNSKETVEVTSVAKHFFIMYLQAAM
jgi:hypothetical protein